MIVHSTIKTHKWQFVLGNIFQIYSTNLIEQRRGGKFNIIMYKDIV